MTIDKHSGQDDQLQRLPATQAEAHALIALEQSALYAARLAIARWSSTSTEAAEVAREAPAPQLGRAAWFAQAQRNFQQWLGQGGFAQYDIAAADLPAPADGPVRSAPTCIG